MYTNCDRLNRATAAYTSVSALATEQSYLKQSKLNSIKPTAFQYPNMGAADVNDPFTPDLGEFNAETTDEWKVAGLSIAVVDGECVFSKVF